MSRPAVDPTAVPDGTLVVGLLSGAHFVNHMYLVLLPPVFGLLMVEFGVTLAELGLAVGVMSFFVMLFQLPFAYVSDHHTRVGAFGVGLALDGLGAFTVALAPSFGWLLVGQAVLGIGLAAHHPAHFPMLSDATAETSRGKAFSVHAFAANIGYAASPVVTTAVLAVPGLSWRHAVGVMGAAGLVYAVAAVPVLLRGVSGEVTRPKGDGPDAREYSVAAIRAEVRDELSSIASAPAVLAFAFLSLVTAVTSWTIRSYAVVLLTDGYGVGLSAANTVLAAMFAAGAAFVLVGGALSDRLWPGWVIIGSYVVLVVMTAAVATFVLPPVLAMGVVVLAGGSILLGVPAKNKLVDRFSSRSNLGQSFAVIMIGVSIGGAIAPPVFGAVIDTAGLGTAFFGVAGIGVISLLVVVAILVRYREPAGTPLGSRT